MGVGYHASSAHAFAECVGERFFDQGPAAFTADEHEMALLTGFLIFELVC